MRKAFVVLQDFSDTSPMPGAHIARLQCITCSRVTPTLEPTFEALMARPEEVRVLLLHDGLAHDPDELAAWAREAQCIPDFFFWGLYLGSNLQEEAAMRGLLLFPQTGYTRYPPTSKARAGYRSDIRATYRCDLEEPSTCLPLRYSNPIARNAAFTGSE
jgi:hypothetical protein